MKRLFIALSLGCTTLFGGFINTNYFHPNQWMMYNPLPKDTLIEDSFTVGLINTSIYEHEADILDYKLDVEIAAVLLQGSKKIASHHRIDVSVPIYHLSGGFMDGLVNTFHKVADIHTPRDRNNETYNEFTYWVKDGNNTVINRSGHHTTVGNMQLELVSRWIEADFDLGTVMGIKIPLNNDPVATTGGVDFLAGILYHQAWKAHHLYANLDLTFNASYALRSVTHNVTERFFAFFAYNYQTQANNRFVLEFKYSTPPFKDPNIEYLYEISSATNIGYIWQIEEKKALEFFALEDNEPYKNYSDVSFGINYRQGF